LGKGVKNEVYRGIDHTDQGRPAKAADEKRLGSPYRSGRSRHWVKSKNPAAPAVKREAEEEWGQ
jgi:hypothetical protein